jgi:SAM-dependent methyltransferase
MPLDHQQSFKEIIRHVIFRLGLNEVLDTVRRGRGRDTGHMGKADLTQVFSDIYANGIWIEHENQTSLSGAGSVASTTDNLSVQLSAFLRNVNCRRLVDVGCGDFNWMSNIDGEFDYLGIDIVQSVIDANDVAYANERRRFICMDATSQPIEPWGDVLVCREVLFHLSFKNALQLLRNIKAAEFKYVLLTSDSSIWFNSDIRNGDFRRINLLKSPFKLPTPQLELVDDKVSDGRLLAVWSSSELAV